MLLDLGADNYDDALTDAVEGGHKEIANMMLEKGATNYDHAM